MPGSMAETSALLILPGGLYLLYRRIITRHIPVAGIASLLEDAIIVADSDGKPVAVYRALQDHQLTGFAFQTTGYGYAGAIEILLGMDPKGELLLGHNPAFMERALIPEYRGFLIALLPPGGFLVLGFLLAGRRRLEHRLAQRTRAADAVAADNTLPL
jgi:hypothetical protein